MLDVHPPHHAANSWRDFFVHIATIVIGLLIAVGLEQGVEAIHHHHQAHHARELLAEEMKSNHKLLLRQEYVLAMHEDYLFQDLLVIDRVRKHAVAPSDRIVLFHPYDPLAEVAWQTAKESGTTSLLSYEESQRYEDIYNLQAIFSATENDSLAALQNTATLFYKGPADRFDPARASHTGGPDAFFGAFGDEAAHRAFEDQSPGSEKLARLTPAQVDRLEQTVQEAIYADEKLENRCKWLEGRYKAFGQ